MKAQFNIGECVARRDVPGITGFVRARDGALVRVYWSRHTQQWINETALMLAGNRARSRSANDPRRERVNHGIR